MKRGRPPGTDLASHSSSGAAEPDGAEHDASKSSAALSMVLESLADLIAARVAVRVASVVASEVMKGARTEEGATHLIDARSAASRLGISRKTLYRRVKDGRITCIVEDGGAKKFRAADLEAYVEERVRSPARAGHLARSTK